MRNMNTPEPRQEEILFPYDKTPRVYVNLRIQAPRWLTPEEYDRLKTVLAEEIKSFPLSETFLNSPL